MSVAMGSRLLIRKVVMQSFFGRQLWIGAGQDDSGTRVNPASKGIGELYRIDRAQCTQRQD